MNPEFLIDDAKRFALALSTEYRQGAPRTDVVVGGEPAYAKMRLAAWSMHESGMISEHDLAIGEKLAIRPQRRPGGRRQRCHRAVSA